MERKRRYSEDKQKGKGCVILLLLVLIILSGIIFTQRAKISKLMSFFHSNSSNTQKTTGYNVLGSIYFVKNNDIWKISGTNTSKLTSLGTVSDLSVNSDGSKAIFSNIQTNESDLYLLDLGTNQLTKLTNNASRNLDSNFWALEPSMSPDGNTILFLSDRSKLSYGNSDLSVFTMKLGSSYPKEITHGYPYTGGDQDPTFYPLNSNYILYTKYIYLQNQPQPFSKIFLMDTASQQSYALTPDLSGTFQASFSPDGTEITFVKRTDAGGVQDADTNVYMMPFSISSLTDTSPDADFEAAFAKKILINSGKDANPVFSPDGSKIAFYKLNNNKFDIAEVDLKKTTDKTGNIIIKAGKENYITSGLEPDTTSRLTWIAQN